MNYFEYWSYFGEQVIQQFGEHILIVLMSIIFGTIIAVSLGIACYRSPVASAIAIKTSGVLLTIPSLAMYVLLIGIIGLGWPPVLVALVIYSLLPIIQNTIIGLNGVDATTVEAAAAIGMTRRQSLAKVELPVAWPVILTGIRVSALMLVSAAAIGAVVNGPGLGQAIYVGLNTIGTPAALYQALTGIAGVALVGLLLNFSFTILGKLTTSRGLHD